MSDVKEPQQSPVFAFAENTLQLLESLERITHTTHTPHRNLLSLTLSLWQLVFAMKPTEQQIQIAQGALFLIDNIGRPPPNTNFREYTDQAITEHLARHTYYYQKKNQSNRIRVTLRWLRQYMRSYWMRKHHNNFPVNANDGYSDALFRYGNTDGFPADVLSTYEYDRAIFSEADLPGYVSQATEAEDDDDALEAYKEKGDHAIEPVPKEASDDGSDLEATSKRRQRGVATRSSSSSKNSQKSFVPANDDKDHAGSENEGHEDPDDDADDSLFGAHDNDLVPRMQKRTSPRSPKR